ncbi:MAG: hypothetical protein ACSHX3_12280 [Litorimonas sp.]
MYDTIIQLKALAQKASTMMDTSDYSDEPLTVGGFARPEKEIARDFRRLINKVSWLCRAPKSFVANSTHEERMRMLTAFTNFESYLPRDLRRAFPHFEAILPLVRSTYVASKTVSTKEIKLNFDRLSSSLNSLDEKIAESERLNERVSEELSAASLNKEKFETLLSELSSHESQLSENSKSVAETQANALKVLQIQNENSSEIKSLLAQAEARLESISKFSSSIDERESQLERQQALSDEFSEKLETYKESFGEIDEEAKTMILNAKRALQLTTAEGLSASFSTRLTAIRSDWTRWVWIGVAVASVIGVVIVGALSFNNETLSLGAYLSRLTITTVLLSSAVFCASQYVKISNLEEDYAFKNVIAKSIVGFSEQFSNPTDSDELKLFIQTALDQMFQDPLRSRRKARNTDEIKVTPDDLKELIDLIKQVRSGA